MIVRCAADQQVSGGIRLLTAGEQKPRGSGGHGLAARRHACVHSAGPESRAYGLTAPPEPSGKVREIAHRTRNRIEAMRAYRSETGADVRTARAVVDKLIENAKAHG
jgi:hypothetical protein